MPQKVCHFVNVQKGDRPMLLDVALESVPKLTFLVHSKSKDLLPQIKLFIAQDVHAAAGTVFTGQLQIVLLLLPPLFPNR